MGTKSANDNKSAGIKKPMRFMEFPPFPRRSIGEHPRSRKCYAAYASADITEIPDIWGVETLLSGRSVRRKIAKIKTPRRVGSGVNGAPTASSRNGSTKS